ncbi:MAG: hypothetical protein IKT00_14925 [Prevotella sp.]|nr:hypothetical protein [Paludibacteraceae bacterium]MBR4390450.1 hypothetical protein [Prevotella sp.]
MNRLVLIGNGFDLAHGLKTSYKDFINWYCDKRVDAFAGNTTKVSEDCLCKFSIKEDASVSCWNVFAFENSYFRDIQRNRTRSGYDVIKELQNHPEIFSVDCSRFFKTIIQSIEKKGWVDIENDYYSLLLRRIMPIISKTDKEVEVLNKQLDILRDYLIKYLRLEQNKDINAIDAIKDKIFRLTDKQEISVANQSSDYDYYWGERNPSTIMLLNFNYTKTPELYVTDPSKVIVNYIHGRIEDPQSVIFGYGDELDEDYKKLQNLNENECLRHIKSIRYMESDNYRKLLEFIEAEPFQICIMGHSCGNSDRTLLNTLFEHRNCISVKPYYYINEKGKDNHLELVQNISRNFTDMKLMRDRVVNKQYCKPLTEP